MKRAEAGILLAASLMGPLTAHSLDSWMSLVEDGRKEARRAKAALMECPGLSDLHHRVHARVGERLWEDRVKPDFMRSITSMAAAEIGDPFPDWESVVKWAHSHPDRACAALEAAALGLPSTTEEK